MAAGLRSTLRASRFALLTLAGVWIGHTVEYVRVAGTAGLRDELTGSLHVYMLPLGATIAMLTMLAGARCGHVWRRLGERLDAAHATLHRVLRGGRPESPALAAPAASAVTARLLPLWARLGAAQVSLYLVQENLEARLGGRAAPGVGAVTGAHWAATIVQLSVALILGAITVLVGRWIARRSLAVATCERVIRWLLLLRRRVPGARPVPSCGLRSPLQRFGPHLWSRPPPATILA